MQPEIENAIIRSTMLGTEDHGIMSAMLMVEGDGWGQGFGGYALDEYSEQAKKRVPTNYMGIFVHGVLDALQLETWEKLPGSMCRIKRDGGQIMAIGHPIKDKWFTPGEAFKR